MKRNTENPGEILDRALDGMRQASAEPGQEEQASARVLQRMMDEHNKVVAHPSSPALGDRIESCDDFRSLMPAYLSASLTPARRLLLEDHVRECVGCRKALDVTRRGASAVTASRGSVRRFPIVKWALPVAAALVVGVALQTTMVRDWIWPIDVHATVKVVDGGLSSVSGQDIKPVKAGQRIERGQSIRTGSMSGAVIELADGTLVEMAARSELQLGRARDGVKVQLARGNVIVKAAKQHGHLYVETGDFNVAVVGTVFSVSAGVKGSRVVVIEGKVQVTQEGRIQSVIPGQQAYTNPAMGEVAYANEIGWSRDAEEWLKELETFGEDMAKRLANKQMRYTSNLVPLVPADTVVLASLPNVSQEFKESYSLFRQRVGENAALAGWWQKASAPQKGMNLDEIANRLAEVGSYLGSEVVIAIPKEANNHAPVPIFLAETSQGESLVSVLEGDLRRLESVNGKPAEWRLVTSKEQLNAGNGSGIVVFVGNGLVAVSDANTVLRTLAIREGKVTNGFVGTPLFTRLEQAYREGTGWLLAVDFQQIVSSRDKADKVAAQVGVDNVKQLVLEQKTGVGSAASRVTLAFDQDRHGIAAWLGAPAPMGSLDFVSTDAYGFSSWVVKDPELILDDVLGLAANVEGGDPAKHLQELQQKLGIDLRRDLAVPLGNEVLVALDGPILPTPSWKVVMEVNDIPRIENVLQWAVTSLNKESELRGLPKWSIESETVDGKTYHSITSKLAPMEIHYTFWMGYMVMAPRRALLTEAIRIHDSGTSIARSAAFRAEMPGDGRDLVSGVMYQNVDAISKAIPPAVSGGLSKDFQQQLRMQTILQRSVPRVAVVYGEQDRIVGAAKGSFGINIASMIGLQGMLEAVGMGQLHR